MTSRKSAFINSTPDWSRLTRNAGGQQALPGASCERVSDRRCDAGGQASNYRDSNELGDCKDHTHAEISIAIASLEVVLCEAD
jgi:hypothetical protein